MGLEVLDPELVDSIQSSLQVAKESERRNGPRRPFRCAQLVAPFNGENAPGAEDFAIVDCHDISSGGFSFYLPDPPDFEYLVLALGRAPFTFLVAMVVHCKPYDLFDESRCLIGCRFLRRLEAER